MYTKFDLNLLKEKNKRFQEAHYTCRELMDERLKKIETLNKILLLLVSALLILKIIRKS